MVSLFWKIQWEKEAVSSALTSALSLCQKSGWPGQGESGAGWRKPAAGGPVTRGCHTVPRGGARGGGVGILGDTLGGTCTHSQGHTSPLMPRDLLTCTDSHRHKVRHILVQDACTRSHTHSHNHRGLTESARDEHAPALSQPHAANKSTQIHVCTHIGPDVDKHRHADKGPHHASPRCHTHMHTSKCPIKTQTDRQFHGEPSGCSQTQAALERGQWLLPPPAACGEDEGLPGRVRKGL